MVTVAMLASQHPLGLTAASPSLYLTDILCFDDESRTVYNLQKKKNLVLGPVRDSSVPLGDHCRIS